jgi:hypothetical protein
LTKQDWKNGSQACQNKKGRKLLAWEYIAEREEDGDEEEEEFDWWKDGADYNEDDKDLNFSMVRVWKEYRDYVSRCPTRSASEWDLDQWDEVEREEFALGNH